MSNDQNKQHQRKRRHGSPARPAGFSLIEVLVVIAVVSLLLALAVPMIARMRAEGRAAVSLANTRAIAVAVQSYADVFSDLPPAFFAPTPGHYPQDPQQTVQVAGRSATGYWFDHAMLYHKALTPALPIRTLQAPARPTDWVETADGSPSTSSADYWLTETLYASPEYWNRWTQTGPAQWQLQRLTEIRYPSDKGLVYQVFAYGLPGRPFQQQVPQFARVSGGVGWADLSAQNLVQADLAPGEPNFHDHWRLAPATFADDGWAIRATKDGVRGRDRN